MMARQRISLVQMLILMFSKLVKDFFEKLKKEVAYREVRHRDTASPNQEPSDEFIDYIMAEGFLPQQVFNCGEISVLYA